MYCIPSCRGCRLAGVCPRGQAPAVAVPERQSPRWPDSLADKLLKCGCRVPLIPIVLGRLHPTAVRCPNGHGWQPMPKHDPQDDNLPDEPSTLF